jgi:hypothetical protein
MRMRIAVTSRRHRTKANSNICTGLQGPCYEKVFSLSHRNSAKR